MFRGRKSSSIALSSFCISSILYWCLVRFCRHVCLWHLRERDHDVPHEMPEVPEAWPALDVVEELGARALESEAPALCASARSERIGEKERPRILVPVPTHEHFEWENVKRTFRSHQPQGRWMRKT